jgi:hypothetical protein
MTTSHFPASLRRLIRELQAAGGQVTRCGSKVAIEGPPQFAEPLTHSPSILSLP